MIDRIPVVLAAMALDAVVGDPPRFYRLVPHPVRALGGLISAGERRLNEAGRSTTGRVALGACLALAVVAIAAATGAAVSMLARGLAYGWIVEIVFASTLLAFRDLHVHVRRVALALNTDVEQARAEVAHVVGRDPATLDAAGIARAAVETTAENFSDGGVAPVFWLLVAGLPGLCAYKAVNTADSMLGYRDTRYEHFGKFAARLDDLANWIPARIAGVLICAAALFTPGAQARRAARLMLRDAGQHRSPNAGWPESAFAGALGLALAGPRRYAAGVVDDAWVGDGRADLTAEDVHAALRLYRGAGAVLAGVLFAAWWKLG